MFRILTEFTTSTVTVTRYFLFLLLRRLKYAQMAFTKRAKMCFFVEKKISFVTHEFVRHFFLYLLLFFGFNGQLKTFLEQNRNVILRITRSAL